MWYGKASYGLRVIVLSLFIVLPSPSWTSGRSEEGPSVSVYSHRHYEVDRALYERFTDRTGIRVDTVNAGADELIERLKAEGARSPADLLVTVDAGRLNRAKADGLLQTVSSPTLEERIPSHLRDIDGYWFGLTKRARVIVRSLERVPPAPSRPMKRSRIRRGGEGSPSGPRRTCTTNRS